MSTRKFVRLVVLPLALAAVFVLAEKPVLAETTGSLAVNVEAFSTSDGGDYFALCMKPQGLAPTAAPRDIVVLFNTSAAQTGDYRVKSMQALKGFLASLGAGDRVRLMAVDLNAVPLTKTFVKPGSPEMAEALAALDARVPLGATDMPNAVQAVVDSFSGEPAGARAAVYIGDGRSAANLVSNEEFASLTAKLADARIPLSSFAVGIRPDPQLLGALAVQSGGTMITDIESLAGEQAGKSLAAAADATVLWPSSVTWPAAVEEVFPKRLPPLRSDRETVVIGKLKAKGALKVEVTADTAAGQEKFAFELPRAASDDNNSYLVSLVEMARIDGGVTLPLVGAASLSEARRAVGSGVRSLTRLAREALSAGSVEKADRLVTEALRRDPHDPEAQAVKGLIAKRGKGGAVAAVPAPVQPAAPKAAPAAEGDLDLVGDEPPAGTEVEQYAHDRRVIAQVIKTEVRNTLNQARSTMDIDPDAAIQQLKLRLEEVRKTPALDPDSRDQFVDVLQAALRDASRRKVEVEYSRQRREENVAAARERVMISENLARDQEKARQLMERFNSLMEEGRYRFAEEVAAVEAQKLIPRSTTPELAVLQARAIGYYSEFMRLREARQKGVIDVLAQVEKSHIPFPDEPPIVYPDAEVWQQLSARRKDRYSAVDLAKRGTAEKKISDALKSPTQLEFIETPLQDVIDYLKEMHQIEIQIDGRALGDVGIGTDTPVTKNLKGISLRSALRLMLRDLSLTYMIKDEVLLITTPEQAETELSTKVYPVADLVLPIPDPSSMGGMGMMGGMGGGMMGGMGGGMGGMGGGMMGGMGGGMGGMGGGMGMFNLPEGVLPKNIPEGGFKAFSIKDDVNALDNAASDKPAQVKPATTDNRPAKIEVEITKDSKPEVVWEEYFSHNEPQPKAVREAVRRLMNDHKFDHVSALIGAALRHRQFQPWMYEALALAMDAAGQPKSEIERAVMSAVDFADTPADLLYVGAFLDRLGLHQRALQVYRQVSELEPLSPEAYMLGLKAARATDNIEGLKWASLGILSQAWPKDQEYVWRAGLGVSKEVLDRLVADKKTKEAKAFEAKLDEAVRRDCIVIVRYTGDADVDIMVKDPTGSVCSLRNPRTTGGGLLLGDGISQVGRDNIGGHSEVYVCPVAFNGKYEVLLRRVWGKITTGKVSVEVITNLGTRSAVEDRQKVSLNKDEAMIAFDLKNGRRKEPLREQQVVNDVKGQLALNRQILAQQLAAAADPRSLLGMAMSRSASSGNEGVGGGAGDELRRMLGSNFSGAVGYQPVITVLPEGAMMSVTAVISADRRYVRITASPQFTGVAEVNVFNTSTGENTSGQGGTGGQGYSGLFGGGSGGGMGGMGGMGGGMGGMGGGVY